MNLWVKRVGQLSMAAVLFFFSCEEDTSLLGFQNPNKKFKVTYVEIPIESSVVRIDSLVTDSYEVLRRGIVGSYADPAMGQVKAESYLEFLTSSTSKLSDISVYDSATIQLHFDFYTYGKAGTSMEKFKIYQLQQRFNDTLSTKYRYYYNSSIPYGTELGEVAVSVDHDYFRKQFKKTAAERDTVLASTRLDDDFGEELFVVSLTNIDSALNKSQVFRERFKGIALVPVESEAVVGFNPYSTFSKITLHYHTEENSQVKDTLERSFTFTLRGFNHIETDRSGTELAGITESYVPFDVPSDNRYVQSGSPVITRLDFAKFYEFADTIDNLIINSAQLLINEVESPEITPAISTFTLRPMIDVPGLFPYQTNAKHIEALSGLYIYASSSNNPFDKYFYVRSDFGANDARAFLSYDSDKDRYNGYITLFAQSLFNTRNSEAPVQYLGLYPISPAPESSVNRTVFNKNNIKLRVYYTRPVQSN